MDLSNDSGSQVRYWMPKPSFPRAMANRSFSSWVWKRSSSKPSSGENEITLVSQFTHRENGFSFFLSFMASVVAGGNVRPNGIRNIVDGHGLQPHTAGAGEDGVEQALAAEEDVLGTMDLLDVHVDTGLEAGHITGIHDDALTGLEDVLHQIAVDLHECRTVAG